MTGEGEKREGFPNQASRTQGTQSRRRREPRHREKGERKKPPGKEGMGRWAHQDPQGSSGGDRMGSSAIAPAPASISPRLAAAADDGSASPYVSSGHQEASAWVAARLHGEDFAKGTGERGKRKSLSGGMGIWMHEDSRSALPPSYHSTPSGTRQGGNAQKDFPRGQGLRPSPETPDPFLMQTRRRHPEGGPRGVMGRHPESGGKGRGRGCGWPPKATAQSGWRDSRVAGETVNGKQSTEKGWARPTRDGKRSQTIK